MTPMNAWTVHARACPHPSSVRPRIQDRSGLPAYTTRITEPLYDDTAFNLLLLNEGSPDIHLPLKQAARAPQPSHQRGGCSRGAVLGRRTPGSGRPG